MQKVMEMQMETETQRCASKSHVTRNGRNLASYLSSSLASYISCISFVAASLASLALPPHHMSHGKNRANGNHVTEANHYPAIIPASHARASSEGNCLVLSRRFRWKHKDIGCGSDSQYSLVCLLVSQLLVAGGTQVCTYSSH